MDFVLEVGIGYLFLYYFLFNDLSDCGLRMLVLPQFQHLLFQLSHGLFEFVLMLLIQLMPVLEFEIFEFELLDGGVQLIDFVFFESRESIELFFHCLGE